jgi:transposase
MRAFAESCRDWLTVVQLPAYAPDLNPVEGVWANMKNGLGNLAACDTHQLAAIVKKPAQAHPVPARAHRRLPRPDRTHPNAMDLRLFT